MTPLELAEEAFDRLTDEERAFFVETNNNPDASFVEPPPFGNLSPAVRLNYLEIAQKGGDASRFGQIVEDILKEEKADGVPSSNVIENVTETDAVIDQNAKGSGESSDNEKLDDTAEELMRHSRAELVEKATGLKLEVAENATKQQITGAILEAQAKAE